MDNENTINKARRWTIAGAIFNCILAFPLSFPFTHEWYIGLLNDLNAMLNLYGKEWIAPIDGANMLFLNTSGIALLLVGMSLLYASGDIKDRIAIPLLNGIVRFVWAIIATYYIISYELLEILYFVVLSDLMFCFVYCYYYFQISRGGSSN